jgi:hypothetical protein
VLVYDVFEVRFMLINDVCKATNLTKKAMEYYIQKRLVDPAILENGYRDFSDKDIETRKYEASLRIKAEKPFGIFLSVTVSDFNAKRPSRCCSTDLVFRRTGIRSKHRLKLPRKA